MQRFAHISFWFLIFFLSGSNHAAVWASTLSDTLRKPKTIISGIKKINEVAPIENKRKEHFKFAIKFNLPVEQISNLSLFDFISDWYGTKYFFGGSTKKGVDCSGFTRELVKEVFCMDLPRMAATQFTKCVRINRDELQPGDLVFFETYKKGLSHVGYYLGDNKFIHSARAKGVTIDDLNDPYYLKSFRTGGRFRKEDEKNP
jgi:lipoprotein Spr